VIEIVTYSEAGFFITNEKERFISEGRPQFINPTCTFIKFSKKKKSAGLLFSYESGQVERCPF
jgi:hypothetical protein